MPSILSFANSTVSPFSSIPSTNLDKIYLSRSFWVLIGPLNAKLGNLEYFLSIVVVGLFLSSILLLSFEILFIVGVILFNKPPTIIFEPSFIKDLFLFDI